MDFACLPFERRLLDVLAILAAAVACLTAASPEFNAETRRASLGEFPELAQYVDDIVRSSNRLFIEFEPSTTFSKLLTAAQSSGLHRELVESLLYPPTSMQMFEKELTILAVYVWANRMDIFRTEGRLALRLMEQARFPCNHLYRQIASIIRSLYPTALYTKDDQDRTVVEHFVYLGTYHDCNDPDYDRAVIDALGRLPIETSDDIWRRSIDRLRPDIWSRFFRPTNKECLRIYPDFQFVCDKLFASRPDRAHFEAAIVKTALRAEIEQRENAKWLDELFPNINLQEFLLHCRGTFQEPFDSSDLDILLFLYEDYIAQHLEEQFLEHLPFFFGSLLASHKAVSAFLARFHTPFASQKDEERDFNSFIVRLLLFHAEHNPLEAQWLLANVEVSTQVNVLEIILNSINEEKINGIENDVVARALADCLQIQHEPQHLPACLILVTLSLRLALITDELRPSISSLTSVKDDLLRYAVAANSIQSGFDYHVDQIRLLYPTVYDRIQLFLPECTPSQPVSLNADNLAMLPRKVQKFDQEYEILERLDEKNNLIVFRARSRLDSTLPEVAVKVLERTSMDTMLPRGVEFFSRFFHSDQIPGVIQLLDLVECRNQFYLITFLVQGTDLLRQTGKILSGDDMTELISALYQMVSILELLHTVGSDFGGIDIHFGSLAMDSESKLVDLNNLIAHSELPSHEYLAEFFTSVSLLLEKIKQNHGALWHERGPEFLQPLTESLTKWSLGTRSLASVLADPIFDNVRDRNVVLYNRYQEYPVLATLSELKKGAPEFRLLSENELCSSGINSPASSVNSPISSANSPISGARSPIPKVFSPMPERVTSRKDAGAQPIIVVACSVSATLGVLGIAWLGWKILCQFKQNRLAARTSSVTSSVPFLASKAAALS